MAALPDCRSFTSPTRQPAQFHACVPAAALLVSGVVSCTVAMASLSTAYIRTLVGPKSCATHLHLMLIASSFDGKQEHT